MRKFYIVIVILFFSVMLTATQKGAWDTSIDSETISNWGYAHKDSNNVFTGVNTFEDTLKAATGRCATLIVAASDASPLSIYQADYVCDGTADDVEIQQAIDSLESWGGGKIKLLEGNFLTDSRIDLKSNVAIEGVSMHSTIVKASATNLYSVFYANEDSNIMISQMTIDANDTERDAGVTTGSCIEIHDSENLIIDNVFAKDGVHENYEHNISIYNSTNVNVKSCISTNAGDDGISVTGSTSNVHITGNYCYDNNHRPEYSSGIELDDAGSALVMPMDIIISDNVFVGNSNNIAIKMHDAGEFYPPLSRVIITDNILKNSSYYGMQLNGFPLGDNPAMWVENITVSDNIFMGNSEVALILGQAVNCLITHNQFVQNERSIVIQEASSGNVVAENMFSNNMNATTTNYDILVRTGSSNNVIRNNSFSDTSSQTGMYIYIDGCDSVSVYGNRSLRQRDMYGSSSTIFESFHNTGEMLSIKKYKYNIGSAGMGANFSIGTPSCAAGDKIIGVQLEVETTLTSIDGGLTWAVAYQGGSAHAITSGLNFAEGTKYSAFFDPNAASPIATGNTWLAVTCEGGTFNGVGKVMARVYYEKIIGLNDAW